MGGDNVCSHRNCRQHRNKSCDCIQEQCKKIYADYHGHDSAQRRKHRRTSCNNGSWPDNCYEDRSGKCDSYKISSTERLACCWPVRSWNTGKVSAVWSEQGKKS